VNSTLQPPARKKLRLCLALFDSFFRISFFSFGGGMAMIPYFHRELVRRRQWLGEEEFVDSLSLSLAVPGPLSSNLALLVGRKTGGITGAACAFIGMISPAVLLAVASGFLLSRYAQNPRVLAFLKGAGAAVVGLIAYGAWLLAARMIMPTPRNPKAPQRRLVHLAMRSHAMLLCGALVAAVLLLHVSPLIALAAVTAVEILVITCSGEEANGNAP